MQRLMQQYRFLLEHYGNNSVQRYEHILVIVDQFCQQHSSPLNAQGDKVGATFWNGRVTLPVGSVDVYQALCQAGYVNAALSESLGGGLPWVLHNMVWELLIKSNLSLSMCPMLTFGVIQVLDQYAPEAVKALYLAKLVNGQCSGTMCLTELQCGSDLSLIETWAKKEGDHYCINGLKVWVTYGEHDLTTNIVHLVLARTEKGLSLFLVPKYWHDGSHNHVMCTSMLDKMGQHAVPTVDLSFRGAKAYLIGEEGKGLGPMFQMMNTARIGAGIQGLAMAEAAYEHALAFAGSRKTSHGLIKNYPMVKKRLKKVAVSNYLMRKLLAYSGCQKDKGNVVFVELLTPVVKSHLSEQGMKNVSMAMQIMGGRGYIRGDTEQCYRDGRVAMIYEGTNEIQALDLLLRKVMKHTKSMQLLLQDLGVNAAYIQRLNKLHQDLCQETAPMVADDYLQLIAKILESALLEVDQLLIEQDKALYQSCLLPEVEALFAVILNTVRHCERVRI